jgi:hypothetical protein
VVRGRPSGLVATELVCTCIVRKASKDIPTWYASQALEAQNDGTLIAQTQVSNVDLIERWVMWWGMFCGLLESRLFVLTSRPLRVCANARCGPVTPTTDRRVSPRTGSPEISFIARYPRAGLKSRFLCLPSAIGNSNVKVSGRPNRRRRLGICVCFLQFQKSTRCSMGLAAVAQTRKRLPYDGARRER